MTGKFHLLVVVTPQTKFISIKLSVGSTKEGLMGTRIFVVTIREGFATRIQK